MGNKLKWHKPEKDKLSKPARHIGHKRNKKRQKIAKVKYSLDAIRQMPETNMREWIDRSRTMTSTEKRLGLERCIERGRHNPVAIVRRTESTRRYDSDGLGWTTVAIREVYAGYVECWDCLEPIQAFRDKSLDNED